MRYFGGKTKCAKRIASHLGSVGTYVEPFMGGLSVAPVVQFERAILNDIYPGLRVLYEAWANGWRPEVKITEEVYKELKAKKDWRDPLSVFAQFAMTRGGESWATYYRSHTQVRDAQREGTNGLTKKLGALAGKNYVFTSSDYRDLDIPSGATVYCDPPYRGCTTYHAAGKFDSDAFWDWATKLSERCRVVVSEYQAPDNWACVAEWRKPVAVKDGSGNYAMERLFEVKK